MTPEPLFKIDANAIRKGGAKAGAYLDAIGQSDLKKLNLAQWEQFCFILVAGSFNAGMEAWVDSFGCNSPVGPDGVPF